MGENFFNDARGAASTLQTAPPFAFSDVKMTVFPLQANLARLNQFCDGYLNQAPKIARFEPFLPFVYLIILDYGRMSSPAANTGWVSQREVAFGVPLRWMERAGDEYKFKDFAFTTPFIFVDNELSLSTGREVYGWPKLLAHLDPSVDEWIRDPHGARQVFEISSRAASDYNGESARTSFMRVTQTPLGGLTDFPPNLKSATGAMTALPSAMAGMARAWRDIAKVGVDMLSDRSETAPKFDKMIDREKVSAFLKGGARQMLNDPKTLTNGMSSIVSAFFPNLYSNTINLKQFRDAAEPMRTCYQAITAAKMPIKRVGGGGMLGAEQVMLGQIGGGYRVEIANSTTVPIMASLGLIPSETRPNGEGSVSVFTPVCPFWIEIDMLYGLGATLAYRGRSGAWRKQASGAEGAQVWTPATAASETPQSPEADDAASPAAKAAPASTAKKAAPAASAVPTPVPLDDPDELADLDDEAAPDFRAIEPTNPFNVTRGASEALGGVFRFPNARVRILPLMADEAVLNRFVADYVGASDHMEVRAWGRYVYMTIANYRTITSDLDPSARFRVREVSFNIPVKYYSVDKSDQVSRIAPNWGSHDEARWRDGDSRLLGTAIITPFNYVDDMGAAITESEIYGVPTLRSFISSPPVGWGGERSDEGVLLETKAIMTPMLGAKMEGARHTLLRVRDEPTVPEGDLAEWRRIAGPWVGRLAEDFDAKVEERGVLEGSTGEWQEQSDGVWRQAWSKNGDWKNGKESFEWTRGAALRVFAGLSGVDTLSLKQFRDASAPDRACYSALVMRPTKIEKLTSLEEIDKDLTVEINRYPTQPVARILGLIPKRTKVTDEGVCDEFEPIRPFELRGDLVKERGRTLFERVASEPWRPVDLPLGLIGWRYASMEDVRRQAKKDPSAKIAYIWRDDKGKSFRYDPHTATDAGLEHLSKNAGDGLGVVHDLKLLSRDVPLGTLWRKYGLRAMDEGRIDDLALFARSRLAPNDDTDVVGRREEDDKQEVFARGLAAALEFVSPATVLDVALSRGWGSLRRRERRDEISPNDFHIRRSTLGPELANGLFPKVECQSSAWPPSAEAVGELQVRIRGAQAQFSAEFRALIDNFKDEAGLVGGRTKHELMLEIAEKTMPEWFRKEYLDLGPTVAKDMPEHAPTGGDEARAMMKQMAPWGPSKSQEVLEATAHFFALWSDVLDAIYNRPAQAAPVASNKGGARKAAGRGKAAKQTAADGGLADIIEMILADPRLKEKVDLRRNMLQANLDPEVQVLYRNWMRILKRLVERASVSSDDLIDREAVNTLEARLSAFPHQAPSSKSG
ncbi:MAG: hypothetical protein AAF360_01625 [Pseudomonadota bacterium]